MCLLRDVFFFQKENTKACVHRIERLTTVFEIEDRRPGTSGAGEAYTNYDWQGFRRERKAFEIGLENRSKIPVVLFVKSIKHIHPSSLKLLNSSEIAGRCTWPYSVPSGSGPTI